MRYPHIQQHDEKDCGAACLSMISDYYGQKLSLSKIRNAIKIDNMGSNIYGIVTGSKLLNIEAEALEGSIDELLKGITDKEIVLPFIARIINSDLYEHFIVIYEFKAKKIVIGDPAKSKISNIDFDTFEKIWQGQIITFIPSINIKKIDERKGSLKKFFKYILVQKKLLLFVFFASIFISIISIWSSTIFEYIIDDAMFGSVVYEDINADTIAKMGTVQTFIYNINKKLEAIFSNIDTVCISIIFLYILQSVLQMLRGYLLLLLTKKIEIPLTLDYYNHLIDLEIGFFDTRKTGELMSRFDDTERIRIAISNTTLTILLDTIMAVGCGIFLFNMNHLLFLITFVTLIIYVLIMLFFRKHIKNSNHIALENEAQVTSYLKETLQGIETIKSYQYEKNIKSKMKSIFEKFIDNILRVGFISNIQDSIIEFVSSVSNVLLLWIGTYLCIQNAITTGTLITYYFLLSYFLNPVSNLINLQPTIQSATVAAERINDILDVALEDNKKIKPKTLKGDIEFKEIDFRYNNRELVLKGLSMIFKKGKKTAIVGESGCGKTTLVKLLMSFYNVENGSILIDGTNILQYSPKAIRERIAYIPQNIFLFSDSIYNNLRMGNSTITNEEIEKMCKLCFIDEFINSLPMRYETILEENGNNLSNGQKQKLAIARAMLRKPDILIMDESTSNLDTISEKGIKEAIDNLSSNITCIFIAHRLNTIKNCDYIYVMKNGYVIEEGNHEELIKKNGLYTNFYSI